MTFNFFGLPLELRTLIYTDALGGGTIHVLKDLKPVSEHRVCLTDAVKTRNKIDLFLWSAQDFRQEIEPHQPVVVTERSFDTVIVSEMRHVLRFTYMNMATPDTEEVTEPTPPHDLSTNLLCTSKQMFMEASQVLWSNNTFYFDDPNDFTCFLNKLECRKLAAIRSISLKMDWFALSDFTDENQKHWISATSSPLQETLPALRSLNLSFGPVGKYNESSHRFNALLYAIQPGALSGFASLSLQNIEIVMKSGPPDHWTDFWTSHRLFFTNCIQKRLKGAIELDEEDLARRKLLEKGRRWEQNYRAGQAYRRRRRLLEDQRRQESGEGGNVPD